MSRAQLNHLGPPFLVQFLLGTPLCAAHFQHNLGILQYVRTCPKCSVASTLFSHVCRFPTHPFVGLLVSAAYSLLSHSTDCQHTDSRIANLKHCHLPDVSHSVSSLHLLASTAEIHRCGQSLPTKTPRIQLMFNMAPSSEWFRPSTPL